MFRSKNIRLNSSSYVGRQFYFVTICCSERNKIFISPRRCSWLLEMFRSASAKYCFAIHAYCLMPDHFHFLAEGLISSSDLLNFVKSFKLRTSRVYRQKTSRVLWQRKFYDHILRPDESPESVAWYIWMNPIRKGLSQQIGAYSFSGSFASRFPPEVMPSKIWYPPKLQESPLKKVGATTA